MSINDIKTFSLSNNIYLSDSELLFIYEFIKNNYNSLIDNPNSFDISSYKNKFSEENFNKIQNLIIKYKKKYNI